MRKNFNTANLPEIVFSSSEPAISQQISKLVKKGKLRKLIPRVYTSNLSDPEEEIIRRNSWMLLAHQFPEAVVSHRSAIEFKPSPNATLYLTGKNRRVYQWPGLTIRMTGGPNRLEDDQPIYESLYVSSLERACLENLMPSRVVDGEKRTLDQIVIEERLLMILNTRGETGLNQLRDRAKEIADQLGWEPSFKKLNQIISSILSTKPSDILRSPMAVAKALGEPYDPYRLELFQHLIGELRNHPFVDRQQKTDRQKAFSLIAFFESFFSNYIEGTTFLIEEAKDIIYEGKIILNRTGDSHDILGTYQICQDRFEMQKKAQNPEAFLELLRDRHRIVMKGRPDKNPGIFKQQANRAGSTHFVTPGQVTGTLKQGYKMLDALTHPLARAIFIMFLVSEVHPFDDGNGRIARIMMNAELVHAHRSKLIIPTVYRDDYLLNLKKLTKKQDAAGYIQMMDRAHAFSHWLEPTDFDALHGQLIRSNAFKESEEAVLVF